MDTTDDSSLHLVDDRGEILGSLKVESQMLESLRSYLEACAGTGYYTQLQSTFAASVKAALQQMLPYHLRQPSEAQVSYAVGIARALDVPVPPEALSQRWAMHEFLDVHVPAFKAKQALRNNAAPEKWSASTGQEEGPRSTAPTNGEADERLEQGTFE